MHKYLRNIACSIFMYVYKYDYVSEKNPGPAFSVGKLSKSEEELKW